MPRSEKETELEAILTEINSGIRKDKNKTADIKPNEKSSDKSANEIKNDEDILKEESVSFINNAKIIEEEPENIDFHIERDKKHIEVEELTDKNSSDETVIHLSPDKHINEKREKTSKSLNNPSRAELKRANGTAVSRNPSNKKKKPTRPQRRMAVLGFFITLFVLIGVISTVWTGVKLTGNIINETSLKEELARVIFPLVIVDIPAFDSPTSLDNSAIISSSIWEFIIDEENKGKYKKDDFGAMYVPDVDIEKYIRQIYGTEVKISHQSVDDSNVQMTYNSESKYYVIESTPRFLPYTPEIEKITKSGDILTLRVNYILPDALWNMEKHNKTKVIDKIMEYTLKKTDKNYQMLSVKLLEVTNNSHNTPENPDTSAVVPSDTANDESDAESDSK